MVRDGQLVASPLPISGLSIGAQQRLALGRLILAKPDWAILDEATSALDPETERRMMGLLRSKLPETTFVIVAPRTGGAWFRAECVTGWTDPNWRRGSGRCDRRSVGRRRAGGDLMQAKRLAGRPGARRLIQGWVERPHPPKLDQARAKPIEAIAPCGLREGSTRRN